MRSERTDFGMTTTSRWMSQRRTTCATDLPSEDAVLLLCYAGRRPHRVPPRGLCTAHAVVPRSTTSAAVTSTGALAYDDSG
jgi:hypothetical protein